MASGNELTKGIKGLSLNEDYVMVVAIDFGTTFSGYAFSFKSSPDDVKCNREWGNEVGVKSYKTPTCVLTDHSNKFKGFGYEALNTYSRELDADRMFHFYDRFKMSLYKEKIIGSKTTTLSRGGRTLPAETILAMSLKYMKEHILKALSDAEVGKIDTEQIRWVITVPAIWSEGAKQLMRRASYKAGIINDENSKKLLIALEPEAASFWCRSLPLNKYQNINTRDKSMPVGTTYMIVDCGGGTIDLTVHETLADGVIKEVHRANGGDWGGTKVDDEFLKLLDDILGVTFTTSYKKNFPQDWLNILLNFETLKRAHVPSDNKSMNISLTYNLAEVVMEELGKSLKKIITDAQLDDVSFSQGMLVMKPKRIEMIFAPVVSQIADHISELLKDAKVKLTKYIFMVGGFSESKMLSNKIRQRFDKTHKVLVPQDAGVCVMKGAVLFGHTPHSIKMRIAKKTYGIAIMPEFDSNIHDEKRVQHFPGEKRVNDVFEKWITKNEPIEEGSCKTFTYFPLDSDTRSIIFKIFCVDREDVLYVDEDGVEKIGTLTLNVPETHLKRDERKVLAHLFFGETEIYLRVENKAGDSTNFEETSINFLSE